jgi:hypothetical protein
MAPENRWVAATDFARQNSSQGGTAPVIPKAFGLEAATRPTQEARAKTGTCAGVPCFVQVCDFE